MRRPNVTDERILAERRKIGSEACSLLMLVLLGSVLVQQYLFDAPFAQYAVEFVCFIGASVYILVRNLLTGINLFGAKKSFRAMVTLNSVVCALTITAINGILGYMRYRESFGGNPGMFILTLTVTFVCAAVASFAALSVLYHLGNKRQAQIEKSLNEEENSGQE